MKKQYFILSAIIALTSCGQEAELGEVERNLAPAITTINASTYAETRATVADNTKVLWQEDDQISVLGTNAESVAKNLPYKLDNSGAGKTGGTFVNAESDITAVSAIMYPYQSTATFSEGTLTCNIPSVQTATANSFDKNAAVMYALGNSVDADLAFAVNFLKVTVSDVDNVHSITVRSNTKLTGSVCITSGGVATTEASEGYVTLAATGTGALATGDYFIAIAKTASIEKPSFIYKYTNGTLAEKTASSNLSFAAGKNVKPVSVDFSNGTVHRAVQLWDDGLYFATCNVGANNPEDYGQYFAWGETTGYGEAPSAYEDSWTGKKNSFYTGMPTKITYSWKFYKWALTDYMYKYCTSSSYGDVDSKTVLEASDDAATANWGGSWRMPTHAEQTKLSTDCYWQWVASYNGKSVNGYVVYKAKAAADKGTYSYKNPTLSASYSVTSDVHIFLPAPGLRKDVERTNDGSFGYYRSSSVYESSPTGAWAFFSGKSVTRQGSYYRYDGISVRPVFQ